jgi:5-methylcytosine-specific restriction endonuclease McrA
MNIVPHKRCCRCRQEKPISEFYKNKSMPDGLNLPCKDCSKASAKRYRQTGDREKKRARDRRHQQKNKPWLKRSRGPERERARELHRKRMSDPEYRERMLQAQRMWKAANPDKVRAAALRRLERSRGNGAAYTIEEWRLLLDFFGPTCLKCGAEQNISADHVIPLALGGVDAIVNIQPLCRTCNSQKQATVIDYRDPHILTRFLQQLQKRK